MTACTSSSYTASTVDDDRPRTSLRPDVVVDVEEVLGVVAPLHVDESLVLRRSEDRAGVEPAVPRRLLPLEVDVLTAGGERPHVRGEAADERDPVDVVGRIGPEPVDVQPEPGGPVREGGGLLRHPAEGAAHEVDVEAGAGPGLFGSPADQDVDHLVVQSVEGGVAPVGPDALGE